MPPIRFPGNCLHKAVQIAQAKGAALFFVGQRAFFPNIFYKPVTAGPIPGKGKWAYWRVEMEAAALVHERRQGQKKETPCALLTISDEILLPAGKLPPPGAPGGLFTNMMENCF